MPSAKLAPRSSGPAPAVDAAAPAQSWANPHSESGAAKGDEEHLFRLQEQVLAAVEKSNQDTKDEVDSAIWVIGILGALVLAVFTYFRVNTAFEAKRMNAEADSLNKKARQLIADLERLEAKFTDTQHEVVEKASEKFIPRLAEVANYGTTMGQFASATWTSMSLENRERYCQEALSAIDKANLGAAANGNRSFVLARRGLSLLDSGDVNEAIDVLKLASVLNDWRRPDRHYNLACAYSIRASASRNQALGAKDRALGLVELQKCFEMATGAAVGDTTSRAYFYRLAVTRSDPELDAIRSEPDFAKITRPYSPSP